jgi:serine/threonine-protein kinase
VYRQLVELQPDNVIGLQGLGTVLQQQGRDDEALRWYEQAIAITPAAQVLSNMGTLYYQRGDYARAAESYRRAIGQRPNSAPTHRNLGDSLRRLGRADEALAAYQRAVALAEEARRVNPNDAQNLAALAVYEVKAERTAEARRHAAEATRLAPEHPTVWFRTAEVQALAGRTNEALAALTRALALGYPAADAGRSDELAALRREPRFMQLLGEAPGAPPP